jgi:hypothetical protein
MLLDESARKGRGSHCNDNLATGDILQELCCHLVLEKVKGVVGTIHVERAHNPLVIEPTKLALDLLSYVCISGSDLSFIAHADRSDVSAETSISVR